MPGVVPASIEIVPITPDRPGFDGLRRASEAEGFPALARLANEWNIGVNTFSRPGERLLGAVRDGELVGLGGLNIDPYSGHPRFGRLRRLYVRPDCRREGIGRALVTALFAHAGQFFSAVNERAPRNAFAFYRRLSFRPRPAENSTHRLPLPFQG